MGITAGEALANRSAGSDVFVGAFFDRARRMASKFILFIVLVVVLRDADWLNLSCSSCRSSPA